MMGLYGAVYAEGVSVGSDGSSFVVGNFITDASAPSPMRATFGSSPTAVLVPKSSASDGFLAKARAACKLYSVLCTHFLFFT
jgi:hypothetical protein